MISVVIPALNEGKTVRRCIERVKAEGADCEIIVVDGGSSDNTLEEVELFQDVLLVQTGKGRGHQLNAGAAAAQGEVLLFLHADTVLEEGWSMAVASAFERDDVAGGAFTFRIDCPGRRYRLTEYWVKLRCRLFILPYGDQGIFVRRDIFDELKGYREIPVMEDVDIVERMRRLGHIAILEKKAYVHARKWIKEGWIRTAVRNQVVMLMYRCGVAPYHLARIYYRGA
jgi:rSAM/selenodomain-associated transferase 2